MYNDINVKKNENSPLIIDKTDNTNTGSINDYGSMTLLSTVYKPKHFPHWLHELRYSGLNPLEDTVSFIDEKSHEKVTLKRIKQDPTGLQAADFTIFKGFSYASGGYSDGHIPLALGFAKPGWWLLGPMLTPPILATLLAITRQTINRFARSPNKRDWIKRLNQLEKIVDTTVAIGSRIAFIFNLLSIYADTLLDENFASNSIARIVVPSLAGLFGLLAWALKNGFNNPAGMPIIPRMFVGSLNGSYIAPVFSILLPDNVGVMTYKQASITLVILQAVNAVFELFRNILPGWTKLRDAFFEGILHPISVSAFSFSFVNDIVAVNNNYNVPNLIFYINLAFHVCMTALVIGRVLNTMVADYEDISDREMFGNNNSPLIINYDDENPEEQQRLVFDKNVEDSDENDNKKILVENKQSDNITFNSDVFSDNDSEENSKSTSSDSFKLNPTVKTLFALPNRGFLITEKDKVPANDDEHALSRSSSMPNLYSANWN